MPEGRVFKYVPATNEFMREARRMAEEHSTEQRHPTGAVVVKDGGIIGKGSNQAVIKNQKMQGLHNNKGLCLRRIVGVKSGEHYWLCPGCAPSTSHAEQVTVKNARKKGNETEDADLYMWGHWWCCEPCWNAMIDLGIKDVYLLENAHILFGKKHPKNNK